MRFRSRLVEVESNEDNWQVCLLKEMLAGHFSGPRSVGDKEHGVARNAEYSRCLPAHIGGLI